MTVTALSPMQRLMLAVRELKSMLGLPVSYRDHEFLYLKEEYDTREGHDEVIKNYMKNLALLKMPKLLYVIILEKL